MYTKQSTKPSTSYVIATHVTNRYASQLQAYIFDWYISEMYLHVCAMYEVKIIKQKPAALYTYFSNYISFNPICHWTDLVAPLQT